MLKLCFSIHQRRQWLCLSINALHIILIFKREESRMKERFPQSHVFALESFQCTTLQGGCHRWRMAGAKGWPLWSRIQFSHQALLGNCSYGWILQLCFPNWIIQLAYASSGMLIGDLSEGLESVSRGSK